MNHLDRTRQALAIGLACLAGYVDAVGFLSADNYFVSFMSGNTTRLAADLAQDWHRAATPALLIAGFVCGVAGGSVVAARAGRWRKPAVLGLVTVLLLLACVANGMELRGTALALLVLGMGALNNTFQRNGEIAVGLTYMTGALVRLGQGIGAALMGQPRSDWPAYLLLWLGLAGGALGGALLFLAIGAPALWLAVLAGGTMAAAGWRIALKDTPS